MLVSTWEHRENKTILPSMAIDYIYLIKNLTMYGTRFDYLRLPPFIGEQMRLDGNIDLIIQTHRYWLARVHKPLGRYSRTNTTILMSSNS